VTAQTAGATPLPQSISIPEVVTVRQLRVQLLDTVTSKESIMWLPDREKGGRWGTIKRETEIIKYDWG